MANKQTGAGHPSDKGQADEPAKPIRPNTVNGVNSEASKSESTHKLAEELGIELTDNESE